MAEKKVTLIFQPLHNITFTFLALPFALSVFATSLYLHFAAPASKTDEMHNTLSKLASLVQVFWAGMIVAICMEAVVKFNARAMAKKLIFDVGRHVFAAFGRVELILSLLLLFLRFFLEVLEQQKAGLVDAQFKAKSFTDIFTLVSAVFSNMLPRLNAKFALNTVPIAFCFVQQIYLQPILDARARQLLEQELCQRKVDEEPVASHAHHFLYLTLELSKLSFLLWNSIKFFQLV